MFLKHQSFNIFQGSFQYTLHVFLCHQQYNYLKLLAFHLLEYHIPYKILLQSDLQIELHFPSFHLPVCTLLLAIVGSLHILPKCHHHTHIRPPELCYKHHHNVHQHKLLLCNSIATASTGNAFAIEDTN